MMSNSTPTHTAAGCSTSGFSPSDRKRLNLGCGRQFHPDWVNVDLVAYVPEVIEADLTRGIPFQEGIFEAVYHSHVLEHMDPNAGRRFLTECFRVLAPGGTLRIAVPDLERIARDYLQALDDVSLGDAAALSRYDWLKLELLDQLVRTRSGGEMGKAMCDASRLSLIAERLGDEVLHVQSPQPQVESRSLVSRLRKKATRLRDRLFGSLLKRLYGKSAAEAWNEARFRSSGEIHRWMYDRVDLCRTLAELGFESVRVCGADESQIDGFNLSGLDTREGRVRKPDSLFIEASKPRAVSERAASSRRAA